MRSTAYLPEWPVGDGAELARASAAAFTSAYGALNASQSARDLVRAELTEDVRVCAQVDAVDIVAQAEPLEGGRRASSPWPDRAQLGVRPRIGQARPGTVVRRGASSSCSLRFSKRRQNTRPAIGRDHDRDRSADAERGLDHVQRVAEEVAEADHRSGTT